MSKISMLLFSFRIAPSNIQEVCTVLQQVIERTPLGHNLDYVIANIESDSTLCNMQARKRVMLQHWLNKNPNASWSALASALDGSYSVRQDVYVRSIVVQVSRRLQTISNIVTIR